MKINAETLGDIFCNVLMECIDGDLSSTRYGELDLSDFDKADIAIQIKRMLAVKQKRIVLDITYPSTNKSPRVKG